MTFRAAASTSSHFAPGRAALRAASWAFLTMSQTLRCLSEAFPKTIVRVTSELNPSTLQPPSTMIVSPGWSVRGTRDPWGKAVAGPNCGPPLPRTPIWVWAADMAPDRSRGDIPSLICLKPSR